MKHLKDKVFFARAILFVLLLASTADLVIFIFRYAQDNWDWLTQYPINCLSDKDFLHTTIIGIIIVGIIAFLNVTFLIKVRRIRSTNGSKPIQLRYLIPAVIATLILTLTFYGISTDFSSCPIGKKWSPSDVPGQTYVCVPWDTDLNIVNAG